MEIVTEQPQIQPETGQGNAFRRNRRFQPQDIESVGKLLAKGLNEREACERLKFSHNSWLTWKSRNKNQARLSEILHRVRGDIIESCIDGIELAGKRDWRALRERLSLLDRDRFSDRVQQPVNTTHINLYQQIGIDVDKLLSAGYQRAMDKQKVIEVQTVKQLENEKPPSV